MTFEAMISRQRVLNAFAHKEGDRTPLDLGGTMMTGIHIEAYRNLRRYLGLSTCRDPELFEPSVRHVFLEDDFYEYLAVDIDTRPVLPSWADSFPLKIADTGESYVYRDEWGYELSMPKESPLYFSLTGFPLAEAEDPHEFNGFPLPDPADDSRYRRMETQIRLAELSGKAVICNNIAAGTMETASWLRRLDNFLIDLALENKNAEILLDRITEIKIRYWKEVFDRFGERVDVVLESDDLGTQDSLLISPETYRRFLKPRHKRIMEYIRSRSRAPILFHSCGAVRPLIPDLIEIGVQGLNPLQFSAAGMDVGELKKEFGRDLLFWGGGVDSQNLLCRGTPDEIAAQVRRQIEILGRDGGFVFAAVHNIQADVPPENIMAMLKAVSSQ